MDSILTSSSGATCQKLAESFNYLLDEYYQNSKNEFADMDDILPLTPKQYSKFETLIDAVTDTGSLSGYNNIIPLPSSCLHFNPFLKIALNKNEASTLSAYFSNLSEPQLSFELPAVIPPESRVNNLTKSSVSTNPVIQALKEDLKASTTSLLDPLPPEKKISATAQFLLRSIENTPFNNAKAFGPSYDISSIPPPSFVPKVQERQKKDTEISPPVSAKNNSISTSPTATIRQVDKTSIQTPAQARPLFDFSSILIPPFNCKRYPLENLPKYSFD
jgi:hypothetical protein